MGAVTVSDLKAEIKTYNYNVLTGGDDDIALRAIHKATMWCEAKVIAALSRLQGAVISTGGGVVLREENVRNLKAGGLIFSLYASPEVILGRVGKNSGRPLLDVPDPLGKIKELMAARLPLYRASGRLIDTSGLTPAEAADMIVRLYNEHKDN